MTEPSLPLLFTRFLDAPGLWKDLGKPLGLTVADFRWLTNVRLNTQALRSLEDPPLFAYRIVLDTPDGSAVPLAGSFAVAGTPQDRAALLYTPFAGLRKHENLDTLAAQLAASLNEAGEDDPLLALMALAQRKRLAAERDISVTWQLIDGDIFDDQRSVIEDGPKANAKAMLDELLQLPTLATMMQDIFAEMLQPAFPGLDQRLTRVSFLPAPDTAKAHWPESMSLNDAALLLYRHPHLSASQARFSHPDHPSANAAVRHWEQSLVTVSGSLLPLLFKRLEQFWNAASADGHSRREYFARALAEQALADIVLKREAQIIEDEHCRDLLRWIRPGLYSGPSRSATLETVRLWEHPGSQVELAGSLMISRSDACLYTPSQGLQVLRDYPDLKDTVLAKFRAAGHEDELYGLLGLEERQRFLGFSRPVVSGEAIAGDIFKVLFEAIVTKQRQNIEYVLQVYRRSDGTVNLEAMFDKALDIRPMIHERLLALETQGRWSTRPVLTGDLQPSQVLADKAAAEARKFASVQLPISEAFSRQPVSSMTEQQAYLLDMKPQIAHALSVGVTGEARLGVLSGSLGDRERAVVETVLNPEQPDRRSRRALNGFRPDAYSLTLLPAGAKTLLPLPNCLLMTERGGLDVQHSGRVLLWTPAMGVEAFGTLDKAQETLRQRLRDSDACVTLLENLAPSASRIHHSYTLGPLHLIEGNVLHHRAQSAIDRFLGLCAHWRGFKLTRTEQDKALTALTVTPPDTNLRRAEALSRSLALQQTWPAWLGKAANDDLRLQVELLEQLRTAGEDGKDYLHGITTLTDYVRKTLKHLLDTRFPGKGLDPDRIRITPTLALAGAARSLTEHALKHVSESQGDFSVSLGPNAALPPALEPKTVRQLLLSLELPTTFARQVSDALTADASGVRKQRFVRRLPWQLLQHAHALKLQQHLSSSAFDLIHQVLDMPDAVARNLVHGIRALVRPLELIKTAGASAVQALGLYLIGPARGSDGPQVLFTPYHADHTFREFADEPALIAALNTPGALQDLLIRRLPEAQRAVFASLFKDSVGQPSEMSLASSPLGGNLLNRLYLDNVRLLEHLLASQSLTGALPDWETVRQLFSKTVSPLSMLLPGKAGAIPFLWQTFKDLQHAAEAIQEHHWTGALADFISGAAQMVTQGRLRLETLLGAGRPAAAQEMKALANPSWETVRTTAPARTGLHEFEAPAVSLQGMIHNVANGTYKDASTQAHYAAVAGKVYRVAQAGAGWRLFGERQEGPALQRSESGLLVLDPDRHTVHFGKGMSILRNRYINEREARLWLNIEARGMEQIRALHPEKARMLIQALDLARYYAFNSLHNLAQLKSLASGSRLDTFLKSFFDVGLIDATLLTKIAKTITPICKALVDPADDLLNTDRFVIGSNRYWQTHLIAFVLEDDDRKRVHFTENFFDQQLDWYKSGLTEPFNVDGHAQASTLIHEFAHQVCNAVDIASLEARRPFADLIATVTGYGLKLKENQERHQREALSLDTPREELFARWSEEDGGWIDMDKLMATNHVAKTVLATTLSPTLEKARDAFFDTLNPHPRIDTILSNADSIAFLICEMGRQLDPVTTPPADLA
ncbi:dermonecrotic toxin domain-containing protein [Pseudomonas sp. NPDC089534]|uniref:dermonecrotic toxin domain-containing protein n=1 Tax=Pseudomonas sp. NPDC089534 TaxID=3364468 RepID=UPI00382BD983